MRIIFLLLSLFCLAQLRPAVAQPLDDWPVLDDGTKAAREFNALRADTRLLLRDKPAEVLERYRQFLAEHPEIKPTTGVAIALSIGQVQSGRLKDPQAAIETYKSALEKYSTAVNSFSLLAPYALLLQAGGKTSEAEALLAAYWDEALVRYYDDPRTSLTTVGPMMQQYVRSLEAAGKREEIVTRLSRAMVEVPALLDEDVQGVRQATGWMYDVLIEQLLALKRVDQALRWARLRFMLCDFTQVAVNRAVSTLARVWRAQGATGEATLRAFGEAQEDPARPNPLLRVPLPAIDAGHLALLSRSSLAREAAFNVQVLSGNFGEAIELAHTSLLKPAAVAPGLRAIARVFKAADLNLYRANAFIDAYQAGEGADSVQAFIGEHVTAEAPTENAPPDAESEAAALKALAELQARFGELEQTRPEEAIARYRRFSDEQPNLPAAAGVLLSAKIAQLYQSAKDTNTALAIYEWALQRYSESPASMRLILDRARLWAAKEAAIAPVKIVVPASIN